MFLSKCLKIENNLEKNNYLRKIGCQNPFRVQLTDKESNNYSRKNTNFKKSKCTKSVQKKELANEKIPGMNQTMCIPEFSS